MIHGACVKVQVAPALSRPLAAWKKTTDSDDVLLLLNVENKQQMEQKFSYAHVWKECDVKKSEVPVNWTKNPSEYERKSLVR